MTEKFYSRSAYTFKRKSRRKIINENRLQIETTMQLTINSKPYCNIKSGLPINL